MDKGELIDYAVSSGAGDWILNKGWDTFVVEPENKQPVELIRSIKLFESPGAFIYGPAGSGKTHAMKAVFNHVLRWKFSLLKGEPPQSTLPIFWISMSLYLESLRRDAELPAKNKALKSSILFIDDLGASTRTEWVVDQVFQLIDYRAERDLQTFITSNLSLDELAKQYTDRIASRIKELCVPVRMEGRDRRADKMKQNFATVIGRMNHNQKEK